MSFSQRDTDNQFEALGLARTAQAGIATARLAAMIERGEHPGDDAAARAAYNSPDQKARRRGLFEQAKRIAAAAIEAASAKISAADTRGESKVAVYKYSYMPGVMDDGLRINRLACELIQGAYNARLPQASTGVDWQPIAWAEAEDGIDTEGNAAPGTTTVTVCLVFGPANAAVLTSGIVWSAEKAEAASERHSEPQIPATD